MKQLNNEVIEQLNYETMKYAKLSLMKKLLFVFSLLVILSLISPTNSLATCQLVPSFPCNPGEHACGESRFTFCCTESEYECLLCDTACETVPESEGYCYSHTSCENQDGAHLGITQDCASPLECCCVGGLPETYCTSDLCDSCEDLDQNPIIVGSVLSCNEDEVSFRLVLRVTGHEDGIADINVYVRNYTIEHRNNSGTVIHSSSSSDEYFILDCHDRICSPQDREIGISSFAENPANYPDGVVHFFALADIELRDEHRNCFQDVLTVSGTCTLGLPPPPTAGCTPNTSCGAGGQCLPTQICNAVGNCVLPEDPNECHCNGGASDALSCGGGGCPPTHWCDLRDAGGVCVSDPECAPCTDTSGNCGANGQCNLLQLCVGGWCTDNAEDCIHELEEESSQEIFCPNEVSIDTAIGCIPVNNTTDFVSFMIRWGMGIGGGIAFILIIVGGFIILTSAGNLEQIKAGKELITAAISGLALVIFSVFILELAGYQILRLPGF